MTTRQSRRPPRSWGRIHRERSGRLQASYIGPDLARRAGVSGGAGLSLRRASVPYPLRRGLKRIGREGVRVHDLRHFAGSQAARVGNLVETMNRLGHSTAKASLIYQHAATGRDRELAAQLSALADVTGTAHMSG